MNFEGCSEQDTLSPTQIFSSLARRLATSGAKPDVDPCIANPGVGQFLKPVYTFGVLLYFIAEEYSTEFFLLK